MVDLTADTSSYVKPGTGKSALETASDFAKLRQQGQSIEANQTFIDSGKLKLMNERWGVINRELSTMAGDPNITPGQVQTRMQNFVKMGFIPPTMYGEFVKQIPTDQKEIPRFLQTTLERGQTTIEAMNWHYGQRRPDIDTGQTTTPALESSKPGFGVRPLTQPIQKQLPPETPVFSPGGEQRLGAQPYQPPASPGPLPIGPVTNPSILGQSNNFGGNVTGATVEPAPIPTSRLPVQQPEPGKPTGPVTGAPAMFEEGKRQLAADQENATARLTAIKPALQALPLMTPDLLTGPIGEKFTKAVAALKGVGFLSTSATNDPTAIRQELVKKLAQYVSSNPVGQRSDAAQTLAEAASPNPNVQVLPALIKLTKDSIILDRVQAARANAFEGNDLSKYGAHRSTFPASVDERAFGLDLMEPKARKALLDDMYKKKGTFEGKKFWKSLGIVKKQGLIDIGAE